MSNGPDGGVAGEEQGVGGGTPFLRFRGDGMRKEREFMGITWSSRSHSGVLLILSQSIESTHSVGSKFINKGRGKISSILILLSQFFHL